MKARIYPWLIGAAALLVFAGYFFFFFTSLFATTASRSAQGILPSVDWTSSAAFAFFLVAVWGFAAVCGLIVAILAALFFGHVSVGADQQEQQPAAMALKRAA